MRITSKQMTNSYLFNSNNTLSKLNEQFDKLETGRSFSKISQNVSAGKKALRVRTAIYKNEQYYTNAATASEQMTAAENSLMSLNDQMQNVMALAEKALNGTNQDETSREIFSSSIEETKESMVQLMNTKYLDKYILGGTNGDAPFSVSEDGELMYNGSIAADISQVDGSFVDADGNKVSLSNDTYIDIGLGLKLNGDSFDEKSVFKMSFSGLEWTGYGSSEITYDTDDGEVTETVSNNMYDILTQMQSALEENDTDRLGALYDHLNEQYDNLLTGISTLGTRSSYLDGVMSRLQDESADLAITQDDIEGINDAEEISKYQEYNYAWLLTLQFGSQVLPQSLMDYIS